MTHFAAIQCREPVQVPAVGALRIAVLTITDAAACDGDDQGLTMAERLLGYGHLMAGCVTMTEDEPLIQQQIQTWIDSGDVDVVLILDNSFLSSGDVPPSVVLMSDNGADQIHSTLFHDPVFGFVSVVNILAARQGARYHA